MREMTLKGRLLMLVILAVVLVVMALAWNIYSERGLLVAKTQTEIVATAQNALSLVDYYHGQEQKGVMTKEAAQAAAEEALLHMHFGGANAKTYYIVAMALDSKTIIVHGGNPAFIGSDVAKAENSTLDSATLLKQRIDAIKAGNGYQFVDVLITPPGSTTKIPKKNVFTFYEPWGWVVGTGVFTTELQNSLNSALVRGIVIAVLVTLVLAAVGIYLARRMLRQIGAEPARLGEILAAAGQGDLTARIPGAPAGSLAAGLERTTIEVGKLVQQVRDEAGKIKAEAQSIASTATQVATAASRQSEATSAMAAGVEELTVSIAHVSNEAVQTQREAEGAAQACSEVEAKVRRAADSMQRISEAIGEASGKIQGLEERAVQISSIAASIKEIAGQTNLLALNAAIEAARAGEQGRGFSVVADEVRKLAERTASATVEIEEMVGSVQRETTSSTETMARVMPMVSEGVELANQMTVALHEISESSVSSVKRVKEVAGATQEQSSASSAIAQQVETIAQMVEETAAAMSGAARSAEDMRGLSERLDELVDAFKV